MLSTPVRKDIREYEPKILFGLSIRQLAYTGLAAAVGCVTFLVARQLVGDDVAGYIILLEVIPLFALGFAKRDGEGFDRYLRRMVRFMFQPKTRIYKTQLTASTAVISEETFKANTKKKEKKSNAKQDEKRNRNPGNECLFTAEVDVRKRRLENRRFFRRDTRARKRHIKKEQFFQAIHKKLAEKKAKNRAANSGLSKDNS